MSIQRIFMPCAFTWGNKGDAALLMAAAQALRRQWPGVRISFQSFTPALDTGKYGERFVAMPINPGGKLNWVIHGIGALAPVLLAAACLFVLGYLVLRRALLALLGASGSLGGLFGLRELVDEIRQADLVVAMPGGYLQATVWRDDYWLLHWLTLMIVSGERKPLVIYAQSVGPFIGIHAWFARKLLDRVDLILVREQYSATRMQELGIPSAKVAVVPDAAFGLSDPGEGLAEITGLLARAAADGRPLVGISVRSHHFPGVDDPSAAMERYLSEVARAADYLVESLGAKVLFVPQCIGIGGNDLAVSEQVVRRMSHPDACEVVADDLSPLGLQSLYGHMRLLVGTRMHANILALCAGTPVVAISYERKTDGIMQRLGLQRHVLDIAAVEGRLIAAVQTAITDSDSYRATLAVAIPKIRSEALQTPQLIAGHFGV